MVDWIDDAFPRAVGAYHVTSDADAVYNCTAWAAADTTRWWSHLPGYYWPATRSARVEDLIAVFRALGYEACDDGRLEAEAVKVAIYAVGARWTHAARQLPDGSWTSKLGQEHDITHPAPESLCGTDYGEIHCFLRRSTRT
jgi:hypothetical protein